MHYNAKCILYYAMTQGDDKSYKCAFIVTDIIIYSNANKNWNNVKLLFSNTFIFIHANLVVDDKISNINLQTIVTNQNNTKWVLCHNIRCNTLFRQRFTYRHITKTPCLNTKKPVVVHRASTTYNKIPCRCSVCVGMYFGDLKLIASYIYLL